MELLSQLNGPLLPRCRLPRHYELKLDNPHTHCRDCGCRLHQQRLKERFPVGIMLGEPKLILVEKRCPQCGKEYSTDTLDFLLPPHGNYALDLIVRVGIARYLEHRQAGEIQRQFEMFYGFTIPESTINHLARRFLDGLAAAHEALAPSLKEWMEKTSGGYILHLDGTCEAGTRICFVAVDGESQFLLLSAQIPTENVKDIESFIRQCVSRFGPPLATVRDLSDNIRTARNNALGDVPDFICQQHLLQNIGEKLCSRLNNELDKALRRHKIKSTLSHNARQLRSNYRKKTPIPPDQFEAYLIDPTSHSKLNTTQLRRQIHIHLIAWVQDYNSDLAGEYFPFDQPVLAFYLRCRKMLGWLDEFLDSTQLSPGLRQPFATLRDRLAPTRDDPNTVALAQALQTAVDQFQELRSIFRLEASGNQSLLRQHAPAETSPQEVQSIENAFQRYREKLDEEIARKAQEPHRAQNARKIADALDKYWKHLFGHTIHPPGRQTPVVVKRTNHPCEHLFARRKRAMRRQTGNAMLAKRLDSAHPAEALVENLTNSDYLEIICNGSLDNLPDYLAAHWPAKTPPISSPSATPIHHRIEVRKRFIRSNSFFEKTAQALQSLTNSTSKNRKNN